MCTMKFQITFEVNTKLADKHIEREIQEQLIHIMTEIRGYHRGGYCYAENNQECGEWGFIAPARSQEG